MTTDWWKLDIDIVDHETLGNAYTTLNDFRTALSGFDDMLSSYSHYDVMTRVLYRHYFSYRLTALRPEKWLRNYFGPKFAEVAPVFEKMYASAELITSPLKNRDFTIKHEGTVSDNGKTTYDNTVAHEASQAGSGYNNMTGKQDDTTGNTKTTDVTSDGTNGTTTSGTNKFSDTPQGAVTNLTNGYLTNVTLTDDTSSDTSHSTDHAENTESGTKSSEVEQSNNYLDTYNKTEERKKSGEDVTENTKTYDDVMTYEGYDNVNVSKLLQAYRETLIDINGRFVDEFAEMFLMVYDWDVDE